MRALLLVGGGILIGVGVSWAEATRSAELKANERIDEEVESYKRVLDNAYSYGVGSEAPVQTEEELMAPGEISPLLNEPEEEKKADIRETPLASVTPGVEYLQHVQEYWDPSATTVETKFEYVSEEDFEDSPAIKEEILIHMGGDAQPLFIQEGVMLVDWADLIPNTILADMYTKCPPGEDKVLYVSNLENGIYYKVLQEIP